VPFSAMWQSASILAWPRNAATKTALMIGVRQSDLPVVSRRPMVKQRLGSGWRMATGEHIGAGGDAERWSHRTLGVERAPAGGAAAPSTDPTATSWCRGEDHDGHRRGDVGDAAGDGVVGRVGQTQHLGRQADVLAEHAAIWR